MVPTFSGRLQTRLFTMLLLGLPWTLLLSLLLAPLADGLAPTLRAGLFTWATTVFLGLAFWEPLYHFLMQFRWDKDWPTLFLLLESVPEGIVVWQLATKFGPAAPGYVVPLLFASTWLVVFLALHGPMRVVFLRWRFRGGRLL
jgi:hypothetical protein